MKKVFIIMVLTVIFSIENFSQKIYLQKIEPPSWFVGMVDTTLQLLVYGPNISLSEPKFTSNQLKIIRINKAENPNYLFIDVVIPQNAKEEVFDIVFTKDDKKIATFNYSLTAKTYKPKGFNASDVIYLLMPDRFANGNQQNDNNPQMKEKANRSNKDGRHGGDLQGIINNIDYFANLGVTTLWLNPILENNNPAYSYHGYGITDFYSVDARFGTNEDYKKLVDLSHQKGLKVIQDVVYNHCSIYHWWINDLPFANWINHNKDFTTSYRGELTTDPHRSQKDFEIFQQGWFVETMPDLNQNNEFLEKYLIQNTIWWIEKMNLDGLRIDTYAYSFEEFGYNLTTTIHKEYPTIKILAEIWFQTIPSTAVFQKNSKIKSNIKSDLDCVTDFGLYFSLNQCFNEDFGWSQAMARLFYTLTQDFLYGDEYNLVTFLDNHDLTRFYSSVGESTEKLKMAMVIILTTRGIPSIYYGTEIGMTGFEHQGHGYIREDMPGGWKQDKTNVFTQTNLNNKQQEIFNFTKKILNWRKTSDAVANGKLIHFVPQNNVYVYFRVSSNQKLMIVINAANTKQTIECSRFSEIIDKQTKGKDILNDTIIELNKIQIDKLSSIIIEIL